MKAFDRHLPSPAAALAVASLLAPARRARLSGWAQGLALGALLVLAPLARAQTDPLPSWNDGAAKQAILAFFKDTTDKASPKFIAPEARIVTFDQDGTTRVEQPNDPEVMRYMRANGYKTYFATGGGQDFVREYAEKVYGIPPEQVIGSAADTVFGYAKDGKAVLNKTHKMVYVDDKTGKPIAIHQMIGRRPVAAFGNSGGDQQMLEYVQAGDGARLMVLVRHDDAAREYAYGAASKVGTFCDALGAEAKQRGWVVSSMKDDWKRIFSWE